MAFTAWKSPSANAIITAGDIAWTNPGNAYANDDVYATAAVPKGGGSSDTQRFTGFGFTSGDIPVGMVPTGVEVRVSALSSGTGTHRFFLKIFDDTNGVSPIEIELPSLTTSEQQQLAGGAGVKWGNVAISRTDVLASTFGVQLYVLNNAFGTRTVSLDHVEIRVEYDAEDNYPVLIGPEVTIDVGSPWTFNFPATTVDKEGLVAVVALFATDIPNTGSFSGGWTVIHTAGQSGGSDGSLRVYWLKKKADGTEGSTTFTFTPSGGTSPVHAHSHVWRVQNWSENINDIYFDTVGTVTGVGAGVDFTNITIPWGAKPSVVIPTMGSINDNRSNGDITSYPSGYVGGFASESTASGRNASLGSCHKFVNAASENPGVMAVATSACVGNSIVVRGGPVIILAQVSESVSASEQVGIAVDKILVLAESVESVEDAAAALTLLRILAEEEQSSEGISFVPGRVHVVDDTVQLAEVTVFARALAYVLAESVSTVEGIVSALVAVRLQSEGVELPETVERYSSIAQWLNETAALSEAGAVVRSLNRLVSETETSDEVTVVYRALLRLLDETSNVTEVSIFSRTIARVLSESESVEDTTVVSVGLLRLLSDILSVSEADAVFRARLVQSDDAIQASEAKEHYKGIAHDTSDSVSMSETIDRSRMLARLLVEGVAVSEAAPRYLGYVRLLTEVQQAVESLALMRNLIRLRNETVRAVENVVRRRELARSVADAVNLIDVPRTHIDLTRLVSEVQSIAEAIDEVVREVTKAVLDYATVELVAAVEIAIGVSKAVGGTASVDKMVEVEIEIDN